MTIVPYMLRITGLFCLVFSLAACAIPRPDPDAFESAQQSIAAAERAGAKELAPVELRFAREKLASARRGMDSGQYDIALWLIRNQFRVGHRAVTRREVPAQGE